MIPVSVDLSIYQGDSYTLFFRLRSQNPDGTAGDYIDLTGSVGASQIRQTAASGAVLAVFDVQISDQVTVPGGVTATLTPADTAGLPPNTGVLVWDIQMTHPDGEVHTYMAGTVTVIAQVTR